MNARTPSLVEQRNTALSWREIAPRFVAACDQFIDEASPRTLLHLLFHGGVIAELGWWLHDDGEIVVDVDVAFRGDVPLSAPLDLHLGTFVDTDDDAVARDDICRLVAQWGSAPIKFDDDADGREVWTCFELWFLEPSNTLARDRSRAALKEDAENCRLDELAYADWVDGVEAELDQRDEAVGEQEGEA